MSHRALLRRKGVLGTDNALVGAEGASSAEFIRYFPFEQRHALWIYSE